MWGENWWDMIYLGPIKRAQSANMSTRISVREEIVCKW